MSVKEIKRKKVAIDYLTLAFDYIEDNIQLDSNSSYISKPISVSLYILPVLSSSFVHTTMLCSFKSANILDTSENLLSIAVVISEGVLRFVAKIFIVVPDFCCAWHRQMLDHMPGHPSC